MLQMCIFTPFLFVSNFPRSRRKILFIQKKIIINVYISNF